MGTLFVVATPIGNLNDFSPSAVEILKSCDVILAEDTRQTIKLLNHFNIKNKMESYHKFNEIKKSDLIIEKLKLGKQIALVSDAGTPCISDPVYILVKKARENEINVIGIPGCSAVITALSICGLDTSSFTFYGFVPTENKQKKELFESIKTSSIRTKVVYESPKRILSLLEYINEQIPNSFVCVCSELTKIHEKCIYGKIDEVYKKMKTDESSNKGEYVVIISNEAQKDIKEDACIEALLVNKMVKNNCSLKEAINKVKEENKSLNKKDIYNASLNLKLRLK